jgi:hypothetical protein
MERHSSDLTYIKEKICQDIPKLVKYAKNDTDKDSISYYIRNIMNAMGELEEKCDDIHAELRYENLKLIEELISVNETLNMVSMYITEQQSKDTRYWYEKLYIYVKTNVIRMKNYII